MTTTTTNDTPATPTVGAGATVYGYSDREAYTVIAVAPGGRRCTLQRDKATLLNGHNSTEADKLTFSPGGFMGHTSGRQRYSYEADPDGEKITATLRKDGTWRVANSKARVVMGVRNEHYDFNF